MTTLIKKALLGAGLAATALVGSVPAMASGYNGGGYRGGYYHGGGAGPAVAAGIFGLAVGAIIASSTHHDSGYYPPEGYYPPQGYYPPTAYEPAPYPAPYVEQGWVWHDGYYWDHDGNRHGRDGRFYGYDQRGGYHGGERRYDGGRGY